MNQLTKEQEKALYGHVALDGIPAEMDAWTMRLEHPLAPSSAGQYVLVGAEPAWIEMHHQVEILDENGDPLPKVWVIFGFPGSREPVINLMPRTNLWSHSPTVLVGNAQRTNRMGYAQHTFATGGEDIWVWDVQDGVLELPSPIIKGCNWVGTKEGAPFIHTGVKLTFQRRRADVEPQGPRLQRIEETLASLQTQLQALSTAQTSDSLIENIRSEVNVLKENQALLLDNLKLRLELLESKLRG